MCAGEAESLDVNAGCKSSMERCHYCRENLSLSLISCIMLTAFVVFFLNRQ